MRHHILFCLFLFSMGPCSGATSFEGVLPWEQFNKTTYTTSSYKDSVVIQTSSTVLANELQKLAQQAHQLTRINFGKAEKGDDKNKLEKIVEEDLKRDGLVSGFVNALTLLYDTVSDMLLYPAFSFLFFIMTLILIFLVAQLVIKIRKDETTPARNIIFLLALHLLIYADLFMVMYSKRKVLFLFMTFQKDLLLVIIAALIGFLLGRSISRKSFEDRNLP